MKVAVIGTGHIGGTLGPGGGRPAPAALSGRENAGPAGKLA
jgi:hypothetical protein